MLFGFQVDVQMGRYICILTIQFIIGGDKAYVTLGHGDWIRWVDLSTNSEGHCETYSYNVTNYTYLNMNVETVTFWGKVEMWILQVR